MTYNYRTKGVCSKEMHIELNDDHTIQAVRVEGGCNGNLKGICSLLCGRSADEAVECLSGLTCGNKATSCPDQIAIAIKEAAEQNK